MPFFGGGIYKFVGSNADGDNGGAFANLAGGTFNVAIGSENLVSVTTGSFNIAIGDDNIPNLTTGNNNVVIGSSSMQEATTARGSVAIGEQALQSVTTGNFNIGIGGGAGIGINTGASNIAIGSALSGINNFVTGSNNIGIGGAALDNVTGDYNIGIGLNAGSSLTSGTSNVVIGKDAGGVDAGVSNVLIGDTAQCNANSNFGIFIGGFQGVQSTADELILIGGSDVADGSAASSNELIVIGSNSLRNSATFANSAVNQRVAVVGGYTARDVISGGNSVAFQNAVIFGHDSLQYGVLTANRIVSDLVSVGNNIQTTNDAAATNRIIIGNDITSTNDNQILIGDASHTSIIIGGQDFSAGPGGGWSEVASGNLPAANFVDITGIAATSRDLYLSVVGLTFSIANTQLLLQFITAGGVIATTYLDLLNTNTSIQNNVTGIPLFFNTSTAVEDKQIDLRIFRAFSTANTYSCEGTSFSSVRMCKFQGRRVVGDVITGIRLIDAAGGNFATGSYALWEMP